MFDHIGIFVANTEKSFLFFEKCLAPLDIRIYQRQPEWGSIIFSGKSDFPFLWVGPASGSYYGTKISAAENRPMHLAFIAPSKKAVDEFHRIGLEFGGVDNGTPEDAGGDAYHAFLLDPDGNNIEAMYRE
ncbi:MAG: VOC family protein [Chthoniobacterales bacterium]